jgi:hypothetical protein
MRSTRYGIAIAAGLILILSLPLMGQSGMRACRARSK